MSMPKKSKRATIRVHGSRRKRMKTERILNAGCGDDLEFGTDFIDNKPFSNKVIKVDMDKDAFPYKDNTFDVLYSAYVINYLKDLPHFLSESYRILKPGGKIILVTVDPSYAIFLNSMKFSNVSWSHPWKSYHLFSKDHIAFWLDDAGFRDITARYGYVKIRKPSLKNSAFRLGTRLLGYKHAVLNK